MKALGSALFALGFGAIIVLVGAGSFYGTDRILRTLLPDVARRIAAAQGHPAPPDSHLPVPAVSGQPTVYQAIVSDVWVGGAMGYDAACRKYGGIPSVCASDAQHYAERVLGANP